MHEVAGRSRLAIDRIEVVLVMLTVVWIQDDWS